MTRLHDLWRRGRRMARDPATDADLFARFARHGDEDAFAELVDRLGPLVYGACRRMLTNPSDAEDAFQATFLVLVRRADDLAGRSVGPWLHRVAVLTARRFRRVYRPSVPPPEGEAPPATAAADARLDLDAALAALPEKYRVPVVLCHLQGWTRRELAAHLGCPESTASSLVGRGLAKLRKRLAGFDAAALAVAGGAAVPHGLSRAATRAAVVFRTNSPAAAVSPAVAELTEGVLRMYRVKHWAVGLAAAAVVVAGVGFGLAGGSAPRVEAQPPSPARPAPDDVNAEREKLEKEIADAKAKLNQLEARRVQAYQREMLKYHDAAKKQAAVEPHIGVWVRPPTSAVLRLDPYLGVERDPNQSAAAALLMSLGQGGNFAGGGMQSEFAINEFTTGRPVVEAHFFDLGSLKTYLTRAAKDPAAPKKLKLHIDKEYPWAKVRPLLDACKEAGFPAAELVSLGGAAADGKQYHVVTTGPRGELVLSFPATGSETVTDALARVDGIAGRPAGARVWVARRAAPDREEQVFPVDVAGITRHGETLTNYQLLPGDRVYVMPAE